jgi:hypothetical protein
MYKALTLLATSFHCYWISSAALFRIRRCWIRLPTPPQNYIPSISGSGQLPDALSGTAILQVLYYCIEKHCPGLCCFCFFLILLFLPISYPVFSSVLIFFILSCPQLLILSFPSFPILFFPHLLNPVLSTTSSFCSHSSFSLGPYSSFSSHPLLMSLTLKFPSLQHPVFLPYRHHGLLSHLSIPLFASRVQVRVERSVFLCIRGKRTGRLLFSVTAMYCLKF